MLNPIYTYINYIWFVNKVFVGNIFKQARVHLFAHMVLNIANLL